MDIKQLSYFKTIVELQSISKAAEALHLAQPALSKMLKNMEVELGLPLIERSTRHFLVTEAGKHLAYRGEQITQLLDMTLQEMVEIQKGESGVIRIGTIGSEMELLLPDLISDFHTNYPSVAFQCNEGSTLEVMDRLKNGLIDIGIVRSPVETAGYHQLVFPTHPMVAAKLTADTWVQKEGSLNWKDLNGEKLIVLNRYAKIIRESCRIAGFEPEFLASVEDTRSLLLLASRGIGTAIVQMDWLQMVSADFHSRVILAESLETQTLVLWPVQRAIPNAAEQFIHSISEKVRQISVDEHRVRLPLSETHVSRLTSFPSTIKTL